MYLEAWQKASLNLGFNEWETSFSNDVDVRKKACELEASPDEFWGANVIHHL